LQNSSAWSYYPDLHADIGDGGDATSPDATFSCHIEVQPGPEAKLSMNEEQREADNTKELFGYYPVILTLHGTGIPATNQVCRHIFPFLCNKYAVSKHRHINYTVYNIY
jgi:hypothetical protein